MKDISQLAKHYFYIRNFNKNVHCSFGVMQTLMYLCTVIRLRSLAE